jgi:membrane associated rhomboid family serine protease
VERDGNTEDGVAYWAHIGGMIAGAALLPLLRHPDVVLFECVAPARTT